MPERPAATVLRSISWKASYATRLLRASPRATQEIYSRGMRRTLVALLAIALVGCGESPSQKQGAEQQEADRKERANRAQQEQRAIVEELAAPHKAVITDRPSFTWTADV